MKFLALFRNLLLTVSTAALAVWQVNRSTSVHLPFLALVLRGLLGRLSRNVI